MRVMQDDLEVRKEELKDKWGQRMNEVEELILPLLKIWQKMEIRENGLSGQIELTY